LGRKTVRILVVSTLTIVPLLTTRLSEPSKTPGGPALESKQKELLQLENELAALKEKMQDFNDIISGVLKKVGLIFADRVKHFNLYPWQEL
jgi:hypothetical protein